MQAHYTQVLARTQRPTEILAAVRNLYAYVFPHSPAGTLVCERTSETRNVRIVIQVAREISTKLGRGRAVLAIAGNDDTDFWCGLFDAGAARFEHNQLAGPQAFTKKPARSVYVEKLCNTFGVSARAAEVTSILTGSQYDGGVKRHAALARALGLPDWSPGIGYSRILAGNVPPEAGAPKMPPDSLWDLWPIPGWVDEIKMEDPEEEFQQLCRRAFGFLVEEFGFRMDPPRRWEPGLWCPCMVYRHQKLIVVIEGAPNLSFVRLCLLDGESRLLDLKGWVARRDPAFLDLCHFAEGPREQIPIFAEALRQCTAAALAGNLQPVSRFEEVGPGFSFCRYTQAQSDRDLARYTGRQSVAPARAVPAAQPAVAARPAPLPLREEFKEKWSGLERLLREREEAYPPRHTWTQGTGLEMTDLYLETCKLYGQSSASERAEIRRFFAGTRNLWNDLSSFSVHAMSLLERTGDSGWLDLALLAHSIDDNKGNDFRDAYLCLAEIYKTAVRRNIRPRAHFLRIAAISSEETSPGLPSMRKFLEDAASSFENALE